MMVRYTTTVHGCIVSNSKYVQLVSSFGDTNRHHVAICGIAEKNSLKKPFPSYNTSINTL